jgi:hypothetical protein
MPKTANISEFSLFKLPRQGSVFVLDDVEFIVKHIEQYKPTDGEYLATCQFSTADCEMSLILRSKKPFKMDDADG